MRRYSVVAVICGLIGLAVLWAVPSVRMGAVARERELGRGQGKTEAPRQSGEVMTGAGDVLAPAELSADEREANTAFDALLAAQQELGARFGENQPPPEAFESWPGEPPPEPLEALPVFSWQDASPEEALSEAYKWFDSLPAVGRLTEGEVTFSENALASAKLTMTRRECRSGVCVMAFAYSPERSADLAKRIGGSRIVPGKDSWSFTVFDEGGVAHGHLFVNTKRIRPDSE